MSGKTEIASLALSHLGNGKQIGNLETDPSAEASAIRMVYPHALKTLLREHDWPFARKTAKLGLLSSRETEGDSWLYEFDYAYLYPADCLNFQKILSGFRRETEEMKIPYQFEYQDTAQVILTDQEDARARYTVLVDDPSRYPVDFTMAFSFLLAVLAASRLKISEHKVKADALDMYAYYLGRAKNSALNEFQRDLPPDPEMIRVRG